MGLNMDWRVYRVRLCHVSSALIEWLEPSSHPLYDICDLGYGRIPVFPTRLSVTKNNQLLLW